MQKLNERHGQESTDKAIRFLSIRLKSRPESGHLATDIDAGRQSLRDKHDAYIQVREERIALTAELGYLDSLLDRKVMDISRTVLVETGGDRTAPKYRKLFPQSPSQQMRPVASDGQERYVEGIISRLKDDEEYKHLSGFIEELENCLSDMALVIEQRKDKYLEESQKETDWRITKDEVQRNYNLTYPYLQLIFQGNDALVESFFSKVSKGNSKSEETTE